MALVMALAVIMATHTIGINSLHSHPLRMMMAVMGMVMALAMLIQQHFSILQPITECIRILARQFNMVIMEDLL